MSLRPATDHDVDHTPACSCSWLDRSDAELVPPPWYRANSAARRRGGAEAGTMLGTIILYTVLNVISMRISPSLCVPLELH